MTPAQSRALDRQKQKMREAGERAVTIRLKSGPLARLDWLAKTYGSRQRAIEALLSD